MTTDLAFLSVAPLNLRNLVKAATELGRYYDECTLGSLNPHFTSSCSL